MTRRLHSIGKTDRRLVPLFSGGTFDADFNAAQGRQPIVIPTPRGTERAYIEAVITGDLLQRWHIVSGMHI